MDIVATVRAVTRAALTACAVAANVDPERISVVPATDPVWGDLIVNVAPACRGVGLEARRAVAEHVAEALNMAPEVAAAEVAATGLVNVTLSVAGLSASLAACLTDGSAFGRGARVEPIAMALAPARARGSVGLGRARAAVVADALARLLAFAGHPVRLAGGCQDPETSESLGRLGVVQRFGAGLPDGWPGCDRAILVHEAEQGDLPLSRGGAAAERVAVAPCRLGASGAPPRPRDAPLREALSLVDGAALRYALLSRAPGQGLDLDPRIAADASHAGPVFDVRYAHARARGVLRRAEAVVPVLDLPQTTTPPARLPELWHPGERDMLRCIALYPDRIAAAAALRDPSRVVVFLAGLARAVHGQWKSSRDQPQLRFVNEEQRDLTKARLGLVTAAALVLHSGLGVLGVSAPDEMR